MKKYLKMVLTFVAIFMIVSVLTISNANTEVTEADIQQFINQHTSVDLNNMTESDVLTIYNELSEQYTNDEMADIIDQYSGELQQGGVSQEIIDAGTTILRSTDTEGLQKFINEDLNINEIQTQIENGASLDEAIANTQIDPTSILLNLLWITPVVLAVVVAGLVLSVYMIAVRWIIYKKAGKHAWAAIIPIYRDVVWLKISGISPWVLLLWLIPIIGWAILGIIMLVSNFKLAKAFGRGFGYGLGLWIIPVVFESIIALSKDIKYEGIE